MIHMSDELDIELTPVMEEELSNNKGDDEEETENE